MGRGPVSVRPCTSYNTSTYRQNNHFCDLGKVACGSLSSRRRPRHLLTGLLFESVDRPRLHRALFRYWRPWCAMVTFLSMNDVASWGRPFPPARNRLFPTPPRADWHCSIWKPLFIFLFRRSVGAVGWQTKNVGRPSKSFSVVRMIYYDHPSHDSSLTPRSARSKIDFASLAFSLLPWSCFPTYRANKDPCHLHIWPITIWAA